MHRVGFSTVLNLNSSLRSQSHRDTTAKSSAHNAIEVLKLTRSAGFASILEDGILNANNDRGGPA